MGIKGLGLLLERFWEFKIDEWKTKVSKSLVVAQSKAYTFSFVFLSLCKSRRTQRLYKLKIIKEVTRTLKNKLTTGTDKSDNCRSQDDGWHNQWNEQI